MCRTGGKWQSASSVVAKEGHGKAILSIYIGAKHFSHPSVLTREST